MAALYITLILSAIFFAVLNVNAFRAKRQAVPEKRRKRTDDFDLDSAADRLSQMIKCKTVSNKDASLVDEEEFEKFRRLLPKLYPVTAEKCGFENIDGGLLIKMKGKSGNAVSVLMAHFDVVSVNEEQWSVEPFSGVIKDGFLWGRGTLDTKCTLFAILESAETLLKNGFTPENDIYFAFGCNEEIAGDCAPSIVRALKKRGIRPEFVLDEGGTIIDGKALCMKEKIAAVAIAEKGPMDVEFSVNGESGHSSKPPKHTAAGRLAKAVYKMEKHRFPMKLTDPVRQMLKAAAPHTPYCKRLILSNPRCFMPIIKLIAKRNNTASAMLQTSMAFTQLSASKGANVLPEEAKAVANVRLAQGQSAEKAVRRMLKSSGNKELSARIVNFSEATPSASTDNKYWHIIKDAIAENFENTVTVPYLMLGGTDSRFYCGIASNIYKFAPLVTSDELLKTIHGNDERIPLDNIEPLVKFFKDVMLEL